MTNAEFTRFGQVLDEISNNGNQTSMGEVMTIHLLMLTRRRKSVIMTPRWAHVDLDRAGLTTHSLFRLYGKRTYKRILVKFVLREPFRHFGGYRRDIGVS